MIDPILDCAVLDSSGTIINVVVATAANAAEAGWIPITGLNPQPWIGWSTSDGGSTWNPPPPPPG